MTSDALIYASRTTGAWCARSERRSGASASEGGREEYAMVPHGHGDEEDALPVSFRDVLTAAERLRGKAHRTPVVTARSFDAEAGMRTWLKCELFQRGGAFKFRGAYNKIDSLDPAQRSRGVIAFSSGNHAQAVALCARLFGLPAVISMPTDAPTVKSPATSGSRARIS